MLRNYLITAVRNTLRHPVYSFINIAGLVLGLTASTFIFLWVWDEINYDQYHPENARSYKVMKSRKYSDGNVTTDPWTSGLLANAMKERMPEVEKASRLAWSEVKLFQYGNVTSYEPGDYADADIFDVLNLTILEGNKDQALPNINSVAISKKLASKFFKDTYAVGKVFRINNKTDAVVTAVFDDLPDNTSETFEFIFPFEVYIQNEFKNLATYDGEGWQYTLVKLNKASGEQDANNNLFKIVKQFEAPADTLVASFLFAMPEWRLHSSFTNGKVSGGRINLVISFSFLALFILLIACVNFTNLSTARAANRSREVGIRKASGASQRLLIKQFLLESIILSVVSLVFAMMFVYLLLPLFNSIVRKQLHFGISNPVILFSLIGISLFTGVLAGSYPAFFLSSFKPVSVLKGNLQSTFKGIGLRRTLVVFQFTMSIVIIVSAFIINDQISFLRNKDLGFDKNNVITVTSTEEIFQHYENFRNQLLQDPSIQSVAVGDGHPMELNGFGYYDWKGKSENDDQYFNTANCDYDYLQTLGFNLIQGRNFSREFPADTANYIITRAAAEHMGFVNPVGEVLTSHERDGVHKGEIIGVIENFHNLYIQESWHPTLFGLATVGKNFGRWANVFIRYEDGKLSEALDHLNNVYKVNSPNFPLRYGFVDQDFEKQFRTEQTIMNLAFCFTALAIGISFLGLFGLASFAAEKRAKEIGIRKVLGASVSGLIVMLCRDYTRLVIYAIIIGTPLAYYMMDQFLSVYPYHTELSMNLFIVPSLLLLLFAIIIVSFQSGKAALQNPVEVLKNE